MHPASRALLPLLALVLLAPRAQAAGAPSPYAYDLRPFAVAAPALVAAWDAARRSDRDPAALAALQTWLARPEDREPLAEATGRWLEARLLAGAGDKEAATAAYEALLDDGDNPFADHARAALADLSPSRVEAAHYRLARSPATPDFLPLALRGCQALLKAKRYQAAAAALRELLVHSMTREARVELTLALANALKEARKTKDAVAALRELWWRSERRADRRRAAAALKALDAPIHREDRLARDLLGVHRWQVKRARRALRQRKLWGKRGKALRRWARALLDRFGDDTDVKRALRLVTRQRRALRRGRFGAAFLYGRAEILRRLDRDDEAIEYYTAAAKHFPRHPLAPFALSEASGLLRYLGRPEEAAPLDRQLAERAGHGEIEREALWRLGFDAILAGDGAAASKWLDRLSRRYGGEVDRHSLTWAERADYWRARAAALTGHPDRAEALLHTLTLRFPMSWYALLARQRLGSAAPRPPADALVVARAPALGAAVAYARLGATDEALAVLRAALDADYLPGSGRALYASLLEATGDAVAAARTLRYHHVPPVPAEAPAAAAFRDWFPIAYQEAIETSALEHDVSPALLAAIAHIESRFSPAERSSAGAIGLCQLMPGTGLALGRQLIGPGFDKRQLYEPDVNLRIAGYYLARLRERFGDHPALILASYNAGNGPVARWFEAWRGADTDVFVERIPYRQARRYVKRVTAMAELYRRLHDVGNAPLTLPATVQGAPAPQERP